MRYTGLRSCAVSSVVMIWPLIACSTRREARFTVSPNTSSPRWITGPACRPTRSPSLLAPTAGSASTAPSIVAAAATAASALGKSAITSSPMVFTTRPRAASTALRISSRQPEIAPCAVVSPAAW